MKILVTGNLGYIGSVLTSTLIEKGFDVTGIDIGYFENNFKIPFLTNRFNFIRHYFNYLFNIYPKIYNYK